MYKKALQTILNIYKSQIKTIKSYCKIPIPMVICTQVNENVTDTVTDNGVKALGGAGSVFKA